MYPLSLLYGLVIYIRNWLFDKEILKSTNFKIPVIAVGNLAVGGTGKTPHTEYIVTILQNNWKVAVLSRGYKRKTKGFYLADDASDFLTLGDEPFQIHNKFPDLIVAVDEKRVHGIKKLQELIPDLQTVILDDAFQHRQVQPGFSILLTDYNHLYCHDMLLPAGRLREPKSGSKRANLIVVTKCPLDIKPIEMRLIETEIKEETNQLVFFSGFEYDEIIPVFPNFEKEKYNYHKLKETQAHVLLVAGIVSPEPILEQINKYTGNVKTLFFEDHHAFQIKDYSLINQMFDYIESEKKVLLVTEKDAARIILDPNFPEKLKSKTYAMPIRVKILHNQEELFIQKIKNYVVENTRNR